MLSQVLLRSATCRCERFRSAKPDSLCDTALRHIPPHGAAPPALAVSTLSLSLSTPSLSCGSDPQVPSSHESSMPAHCRIHARPVIAQRGALTRRGGARLAAAVQDSHVVSEAPAAGVTVAGLTRQPSAAKNRDSVAPRGLQCVVSESLATPSRPCAAACALGGLPDLCEVARVDSGRRLLDSSMVVLAAPVTCEGLGGSRRARLVLMTRKKAWMKKPITRG